MHNLLFDGRVSHKVRPFRILVSLIYFGMSSPFLRHVGVCLAPFGRLGSFLVVASRLELPVSPKMNKMSTIFLYLHRMAPEGPQGELRPVFVSFRFGSIRFVSFRFALFLRHVGVCLAPFGRLGSFFGGGFSP